MPSLPQWQQRGFLTGRVPEACMSCCAVFLLCGIQHLPVQMQSEKQALLCISQHTWLGATLSTPQVALGLHSLGDGEEAGLAFHFLPINS